MLSSLLPLSALQLGVWIGRGSADRVTASYHCSAAPGMGLPRKIRQLKADLRKAGFVPDTEKGKGSHVVWEHPDVAAAVTLSGKDGQDAKPYQEADVRKAIARVQQAARSSR